MRGAAEALPSATGIVLAGGRSRRFGRDKLAEPVHGVPLLHHPVRALADLVREIVVIAGSGAPPPDVPGADELGVIVHTAFDAEPDGGPLVGLLAGLERASEPLVIVVGGDMPSLVREVLRALLVTVAAAPDAAAAGLLARGRLEPLPLALRTGAGTHAVRRLIASGERRLGAVADVVRVRVLDEWEWRPLDPAAATLRDIDVPADLNRWG